MDFARLEQNIIDVIKEGQVKLGYRPEEVRLYYPLKSLNALLQTDCDREQMDVCLRAFSDAAGSRLGEVETSHEGDRFCFRLPKEASEYVHGHTAQSGFLYDFLDTVSRHGIGIEDVVQVFQQYSDCVHVEKVTHGEFDYLVYFENGQPDAYRYCLTDEGGHMIYHRFTEDDYREFAF